MARAENLGGKFITLVERIRPVPPPSSRGPLKVAIRYPKKPDVSLAAGPVADLYDSVMEAFLRRYSPREDSPVSEREVRRRFERAVQDSLGQRGQGQSRRSAAFGRRLRREARLLQQGLGLPPVVWQVYLPLHAPHVTKETSFGRVDFLPRDSPTAIRLRTQIPDVASAFDVAVIARLKVQAVDGTAARSIGIRYLRHTLDVLDFVEPTVEAPYLEPAASFEPMEAPGESAAVAVHDGRADYSTLSYNVRVRHLVRARRTPLERAIDRLLLSEATTLGRRLSTAVAWAGRANVQRRRDQAFLMKMMALEAALTRDEARGGVTERLRLRVAQVIGGSKSQRSASYAQMQGFYNLRSRIVHAGNAEALTDAAMKEVTRVARLVLERLLTATPFRQMSTEQDLEEWFEQQLLAGGKRT
jgi:hypothetical protein